MSNSEYWRKRFEQVTESELKKADMYQKILEREYQKAIVQIQKDIDTWYNRFAKDNKVTYAESKRMLNSKELQELKWTLDDYIKHGEENNINGKWVQQLKNASARVHISRLESLQIQLQQHAEVVFGNQLDDLDDVLRDIYESGYYHSIFEIQKGLGLGSSFTKLDTARINKVLSKPWTDDGRAFSSRIWNNRSKLVNELHTGLTQSLIRGEPVEKLAKRLSERFDVSKNRAVALVQTESAYFANAAQQDSFREIGVDKLEIVGTLDGHTCSTCRAMDGKVVDGSDAKPGITTPPYHTRCRCCTAPAVDEKIGERVAKDVGGTNYGVPADMKYSDWKKKFVDKKDDVGDNKTVEKQGGTLEKSVDNSSVSSIINIGSDMKMNLLIDRFTPCLENAVTGEIVPTTFGKASKSELKKLKGWKFNWLDKDLSKAEIYKLCVKGDDMIQGLVAVTEFERDQALYVNIAESAPHNFGNNKEYNGVGGHLFAIAANESKRRGYGGFVFMDAKNIELVEHYREALGAVLLGRPHPYRMFIDEESAEHLLKIYTFEEV